MKQNQLLLFLFVAVLIGSLAITGYIGYTRSMAKVVNHYQQEIPKQWGPFFKTTHFALLIHGQLKKVDGLVWTVENQREQVEIQTLPGQKAILGNEFSLVDSVNWKNVDLLSVLPKDEVYINGYYHPVDKQIVAVIIFVKKR